MEVEPFGGPCRLDPCRRRLCPLQAPLLVGVVALAPIQRHRAAVAVRPPRIQAEAALGLDVTGVLVDAPGLVGVRRPARTQENLAARIEAPAILAAQLPRREVVVPELVPGSTIANLHVDLLASGQADAGEVRYLHHLDGTLRLEVGRKGSGWCGGDERSCSGQGCCRRRGGGNLRGRCGWYERGGRRERGGGRRERGGSRRERGGGRLHGCGCLCLRGR
mmetsp:Transcript_4487/g.13165  ORF Transcript_4487/g.13165 Transcript_4487/m.13165 type:complete len:220 (+) Transcript_4487:185-844(+)